MVQDLSRKKCLLTHCYGYGYEISFAGNGYPHDVFVGFGDPECPSFILCLFFIFIFGVVRIVLLSLVYIQALTVSPSNFYSY